MENKKTHESKTGRCQTKRRSTKLVNSLETKGIKYEKLPPRLVASICLNARERKELHSAIRRLTELIPEENILGPAICVFNFISSYKEGFDVEVGFPVVGAVQSNEVKTRTLPEMEVLSLTHQGTIQSLGESIRLLYGSAYELGLISDEFRCERYLDSNNPEGNEIELQFVLHNWNELFGRNVARVLGEDTRQEVVLGCNELHLDSSVDERFKWVRRVLDNLDQIAKEDEKCDILSRCAHVFPKKPIERARTVYESAKSNTKDGLKAVDAVIQFMGEDRAWEETPIRKGNILYWRKGPRDPKAYNEARNDPEKRKAHCYCPLIRDHLEGDVPSAFCYCGAGWYRQQWEGILSKEVRIEVIKLVSRGDEICEFAIHLPDL